MQCFSKKAASDLGLPPALVEIDGGEFPIDRDWANQCPFVGVTEFLQ